MPPSAPDTCSWLDTIWLICFTASHKSQFSWCVSCNVAADSNAKCIGSHEGCRHWKGLICTFDIGLYHRHRTQHHRHRSAQPTSGCTTDISLCTTNVGLGGAYHWIDLKNHHEPEGGAGVLESSHASLAMAKRFCIENIGLINIEPISLLPGRSVISNRSWLLCCLHPFVRVNRARAMHHFHFKIGNISWHWQHFLTSRRLLVWFALIWLRPFIQRVPKITDCMNPFWLASLSAGNVKLSPIKLPQCLKPTEGESGVCWTGSTCPHPFN